MSGSEDGRKQFAPQNRNRIKFYITTTGEKMATKAKAAKPKKNEAYDQLSSIFYKRIYRVQDEFLDMGRQFIGDWLEDADKRGQFNDAVDWMFSEDAEKLMKSNEGVFAFEIVKYVWEKFLEGDEDNSCDEDDEENDKAEEDDEDKEEVSIYNAAREWFDV